MPKTYIWIYVVHWRYDIPILVFICLERQWQFPTLDSITTSLKSHQPPAFVSAVTIYSTNQKKNALQLHYKYVFTNTAVTATVRENLSCDNRAERGGATTAGQKQIDGSNANFNYLIFHLTLHYYCKNTVILAKDGVIAKNLATFLHECARSCTHFYLTLRVGMSTIVDVLVPPRNADGNYSRQARYEYHS